MSDEKDKKEILQAIEGLRQQNSVQHDEQISVLRLLNEIGLWLKSWAQRLNK